MEKSKAELLTKQMNEIILLFRSVEVLICDLRDDCKDDSAEEDMAQYSLKLASTMEAQSHILAFMIHSAVSWNNK